jgi:hypothetical protein
MLVTEEEAKTKQCPLWGMATWFSHQVERMPEATLLGTIRCGASECMMWRWSEMRGLMITMEHKDGCPYFDRGLVGARNLGGSCAGCGVKPTETKQASRGYCGLGGKP